MILTVVLAACGQDQQRVQQGSKSDVDKIPSQLYDVFEHGREETSQNQPEKKEGMKNYTNVSDELFAEKKLKAAHFKVKGIYVSGWIAGSRKMDKLIKMVNDTEINAMVIDVKNDSGEITYDSNVLLVNELKSDHRKMIPNIRQLMEELEEKNIYTIARLVVFKDPFLALKKQELAMHYKSGKLWKDQKGIAWVDPYQEEVWNYNLNIAKEAADLGFDEIQFDYVRFPDNGKKVNEEVRYYNFQDKSKAELISDFLKTAVNNLHDRGVYVSADVFGLTTTSMDDMGIGQDWNRITQEVDFISPMIYPSHYSNGMYGLIHPDLNPYEIVKQSLKDGKKKNHNLMKEHKSTAVIRPWIQSFSATWIHPHLTYTHTEIKQQIKAAQDQGIDEYLLWNPKCEYTFK